MSGLLIMIKKSKLPIFLIIPFVSILILIVQIFNMKKNNLSSWKGGGFGMFSSIDAPIHRSMKLTVLVENNKMLPIQIPRVLKNHANFILVFPSNENIFSFKKKIREMVWFERDGFLLPLHEEILKNENIYSDPPRPVSIKEIEIDFKKIFFESKNYSVEKVVFKKR